MRDCLGMFRKKHRRFLAVRKCALSGFGGQGEPKPWQCDVAKQRALHIWSEVTYVRGLERRAINHLTQIGNACEYGLQQASLPRQCKKMRRLIHNGAMVGKYFCNYNLISLDKSSGGVLLLDVFHRRLSRAMHE